MFGSEILDVIVTMTFIFATLSLIATSTREVIEGYLQTRAVHLERGVRLLFGEFAGTPCLTKKLYQHSLIDPLYSGDYPPLLAQSWFGPQGFKRAPLHSNLPSYIPARNFALALLDIAGRPLASDGTADAPLTVAGIKTQIDRLVPSPAVRRAIAIALDDAGDNLEIARTNIEKWFDSAMDRVSGVYRKETQWVLFAIGLLLAVIFNINTLSIAARLYVNQPAREAIIAQANAVVLAEKKDLPAVLGAIGCDPEMKGGGAGSSAAPTGRQITTQADCTTARLERIGVPMGWDIDDVEFRPDPATIGRNLWFLLFAIPGWLLTAIGISLGAPFWFDLLNKLMVIRSTVKPHEKSPEEASEDRQLPASPRPVPLVVSVATPPPAAHAAPARAAGHAGRIEADDDEEAFRQTGEKLDPLEPDA